MSPPAAEQVAVTDGGARRGRPALVWMIGVLLAGIAIVALVLLTRPQASNRSSAGSAHLRVVRLTTAPGAVSDNKRTLAVLIGGTMPHGTVRATVMTDEDCVPDAQGYSHCRNDVRLAGGSVLHLRHNHQMSLVPCLSPGEQVIVKGA